VGLPLVCLGIFLVNYKRLNHEGSPERDSAFPRALTGKKT
jgi:hypothetical protein